MEIKSEFQINYEQCLTYSNEELQDLLYTNNILGREELESKKEICNILARSIDFNDENFELRNKNMLSIFPYGVKNSVVTPKRKPPPLPKKYPLKGWRNVPLPLLKYQAQTQFPYGELPLEVAYDINQYLSLKDVENLALINKQSYYNQYNYIQKKSQSLQDEVKSFIYSNLSSEDIKKLYSRLEFNKNRWIQEKVLLSVPPKSVPFIIEFYKQLIKLGGHISFEDLITTKYNYKEYTTRFDVVRFLLSHNIPGIDITKYNLATMREYLEKYNYLNAIKTDYSDIIELSRSHPNNDPFVGYYH